MRHTASIPVGGSYSEGHFYRNTLEVEGDGKMVDSWFQNAGGEWREGHVIEFAEQKARR